MIKAAPKKVVDDDDEEDEDDAPPPKKKPAAKKKVVDEDDDDDDENEDDEDDTPKKKSKYKSKGQKGGSKKLLLIGGAAALLFFLCGGGAIGAYFLFFNDSPKAAFEDFAAAAEKPDGSRMWDRLDKRSQEEAVKSMESMQQFGDPKHKDKRGRELFIAIVDDSKDSKGKNFTNRIIRDKSTVITSTSSGSSGSVTVKTLDGSILNVPCTKEDGRWRLQLWNVK